MSTPSYKFELAADTHPSTEPASWPTHTRKHCEALLTTMHMLQQLTRPLSMYMHISCILCSEALASTAATMHSKPVTSHPGWATCDSKASYGDAPLLSSLSGKDIPMRAARFPAGPGSPC